MDKEQLDPVAAHLIASYSETAIYSRQFRDDHEMAPSLMAKVHTFRSIMQARLAHDERYQLSSHYAEYGRVGFTDRTTETAYLLRSAGALNIERSNRLGQLALFGVSKLVKRSAVQLVVYDFQRHGLAVSVVATASRGDQKRLRAVGDPVSVGFWPYADDEISPFDQQARDPFDEVGDLGDDAAQEGDAE